MKCFEHFDATEFMNPVKKHLDLYEMLSQLIFLLTTVAYPELVSRGVSKNRKFKWLVKVGACKDVNPLI